MVAALNEPAPWNRGVHTGRGPANRRANPGNGQVTGPREPDADLVSAAATSAVPSAATEPSQADPAEAGHAELMAAIESGCTRQMPLPVIAGRIAESLPTGPDLAGWLAIAPVGQLEDGALAGVASSFRRLASWAQAGELATVAEMASRSAAADKKIGVDADGRPARIPDDACAQVSLALVMSQCSATWWTDLGVILAWRLSATGAALRAGEIDLPRARLIAEATAFGDDEIARAIEARVLPSAGRQTTAQLRAALRRAVIAADPEGTDRRRKEAEQRAKVCLYPDEEGTASLAGYSLPGVRAAAAMARISALARAMKASGVGGGTDLLRAQVFLGLLLGTLPYIPPAPDAPPDPPTGDSPGPRAGDPPGPRAGDPPGPRAGDPPGPRAGDPPGPRRGDPPVHRHSGGRCRGGPDSGGQTGVPPDDEYSGGWYRGEPDSEDDGWPDSRPAPAWPGITASLLPAPAAMGWLRPGSGGLLDLTLPLAAMTGDSPEPGYLSRLGPITPAQARHLTGLAVGHEAVKWRLVLISATGQTLAVTRIPRSARASPGGTAARPSGREPPLVGRVTFTVSREVLDRLPSASGEVPGRLPSASGEVPGRLPSASGEVPGRLHSADAAAAILTRAVNAAAKVAIRAAERAAADATADGGCAHAEASPCYRPPPRLREQVTARDVTCRFPTCRQPVWRCDLDHSVPYDQGGPTCLCNLGSLCRFHHQLKQQPGWELTQPVPGRFEWMTPLGRAYRVEPDSHS